MKRGIDYFSFDVDFFEDEKIQFISARFGIKGEIFTIRLLTRIYRVGYYIHWDDDAAFLFSKVAGRGEIAPDLANSIVHELVKRGFFNKSLFNSFRILTSRGIQERYLKACERRKFVEVDQKYLLVDPQNFKNIHVLTSSTHSKDKCIHDVNISNGNVYISKKNDNVFPQSKVKESKVKESKGEEIHTEIDLPDNKQNNKGSPNPEVNQEIKDEAMLLMGGIGPAQYAQLKEMVSLYPASDIIDAVRTARKRDKRSLAYVEGILRSWARNGKDKQPVSQKHVRHEPTTDEWEKVTAL